MGIPLMYAVLGPINTIPYMILVFFHGIVHFTYTVIIIEVYRNRNKPFLIPARSFTRFNICGKSLYCFVPLTSYAISGK